MNCVQALAIAAAALVAAGEPVLAPLAHAQAVVAAGAAQTEAMSRAAIADAVEELAALLESRYVVPEQGVAYAEAIRSDARAGAFDGKSETELAAALQTRVNGVQRDRHFRVVSAGDDQGGDMSAEEAIGDGAWMRDGVAYLPIRMFPDDQASQQRMRRLLSSFSGAHTLILDMRTCYGGSLPVIDVLFGELYPTSVHAMTIDFRRGADPEAEAEFAHYASMRRADAPQGVSRWEHWATPGAASLAHAQVIALTGRTISACEHVALALQHTGRGTLIGERTFGAGYYGTMARFGGNLEAWVSTGNSYNPKTGQGWEGVGIEPDIATTRAGALDYALQHIAQARRASLPIPDASIHATRSARV